MISSFSRLVIQSGFPEAAITLLKYRALPEVDLEGDGDDRAIVYLNLAWAARDAGDLNLRLSCLRLAAKSGSERLRFGAAQQLAFTVLNLAKDPHKAVELYDDLVADPYFCRSPKAAQAAIRCSRYTARFLANQLTLADADGFAATFADSKEFLEPANRVSVAIDLALFLRSVGDRAQARAVLEAELWTALDLGDGDAHLRKGYVEACSAAGMPLSPGLDILRR